MIKEVLRTKKIPTRPLLEGYMDYALEQNPGESGGVLARVGVEFRNYYLILLDLTPAEMVYNINDLYRAAESLYAVVHPNDIVKQDFDPEEYKKNRDSAIDSRLGIKIRGAAAEAIVITALRKSMFDRFKGLSGAAYMANNTVDQSGVDAIAAIKMPAGNVLQYGVQVKSSSSIYDYMGRYFTDPETEDQFTQELQISNWGQILVHLFDVVEIDQLRKEDKLDTNPDVVKQLFDFPRRLDNFNAHYENNINKIIFGGLFAVVDFSNGGMVDLAASRRYRNRFIMRFRDLYKRIRLMLHL